MEVGHGERQSERERDGEGKKRQRNGRRSSINVRFTEIGNSAPEM